MESKSMITASLILPLALAGGSGNDGCTAKVYDNHNLRGSTHEYRDGSHKSLGWWNDRIEAIEVEGGSGCWATFCEHTNFEGKCSGPLRYPDGVKFPPGSQIRNHISSIKVGRDRRRIDEDSLKQDLGDDGEIFTTEGDRTMKVYDPLCEAVYHDMQDFGWQLFANSTIKHWEMEHLAENCEKSFSEQDDVDRCKFYVYAATEILDDDSILKTLDIPASEGNDQMSEYKRCGLLNAKINAVVESGKLSGVEIVDMDGEEYFSLEDPITADSVDLVPNDGGKFNAVVSAGSLLAMWIGSTLVKVCRDFDATTGAWMLA